MYSKKGKPFVVDGVFCHHCIAESESESESESELDHEEFRQEELTDSFNPLKQSVDLSETHEEFSLEKQQESPLKEELGTIEATPLSKIEMKDIRPTSFCAFIMALNWMNFTILRKSMLGIIISILLMVIWFLLVIGQDFLGLIMYRSCPDGSYTLNSCINNSAPMSWFPFTDREFLSDGML